MEAVVVKSRCYSNIFLLDLKKTMIIGVPAKMQTEHVPSMKPERQANTIGIQLLILLIYPAEGLLSDNYSGWKWTAAVSNFGTELIPFRRIT
jgi:hypothetical protein